MPIRPFRWVKERWLRRKYLPLKVETPQELHYPGPSYKPYKRKEPPIVSPAAKRRRYAEGAADYRAERLAMGHLLDIAGIKKGDLDGKRVVDVGAGPGGNLDEIRDIGHKIKPVALDAVGEWFARDEYKSGGKKPVVSDSGEKAGIALKDGISHLTICTNVIDRHSDPKKLVEELSRVTERGGCVIISSPWPITPFDEKYGQYTPDGNRLDTRGGYYGDLHSLAEEAKKHGLGIMAWTRIPYQTISQKGPEVHHSVAVAFRKQ